MLVMIKISMEIQKTVEGNFQSQSKSRTKETRYFIQIHNKHFVQPY